MLRWCEFYREEPGRVRVLIPNTNMGDSGFHDVTLLDMAEAVGPAVPVGDLTILRRQWPLSVVSGMSRR